MIPISIRPTHPQDYTLMTPIDSEQGARPTRSQSAISKNPGSALLSAAGFVDGINPMDPLNQWLNELFNLIPEYHSDPSYKTGHELGQGLKEEFLAAAHPILEAGGMVPGIGEPLDLINGGLYVLSEDYTNAGFSMAAVIPLGGVFAAGAKVVKKVDTMDLTPAGVASILEQTTVQAEKVGRAIRDKNIKVNILGTPLFDKALRQFGIDPADKVVALAHADHIYINRDSRSFFADIVHEGTHALDHLNDFMGDVYQWEKRAFYHDQQFQKWVDGHLDFKDMNEMVKTIHDLY